MPVLLVVVLLSSPASKSDPVRVGIADDAVEVQRFMELYLQRHEQIEVVGVAGSGPAALALVAERSPDVLLLDLDMPGMDGFDVLAALADRNHVRTRVIVVSGLELADVEQRCLELGAVRVLDKARGFEELPAAVLEVAGGAS